MIHPAYGSAGRRPEGEWVCAVNGQGSVRVVRVRGGLLRAPIVCHACGLPVCRLLLPAVMSGTPVCLLSGDADLFTSGSDRATVIGQVKA
jgi:hypothetical protein